MRSRFSRTLVELFALLSMCPACVSSTRTSPAQTTTPIACAPNDRSWGCQSVPATTSSPISAPQAAPPNQVTTTVTPPAPNTPIASPAATAATPSASTTNTAPTPTAAVPPPNPTTPTSSGNDPLNLTDSSYMRAEAQLIVGELINALDASLRPRVASIPLVFDPSRTEVNAYATCSRSGKSAVAITDGMLVLCANLAELKAVDEVFGTQRFAEYANYVATHQRSGEAIVPPPASWLTTEQRNNAQKLARHHHLFDETLAFVFAHELAHHYLNHLPCTSVLPLNASELGIMLTDSVPAFNQPNEAAADTAGIRNVLLAGRRRAKAQLTEVGGLAQLEFFGRLDSARPIDVFSFERTHPPPSVRKPIVQSAAQAFRLASGITWPFGT